MLRYVRRDSSNNNITKYKSLGYSSNAVFIHNGNTVDGELFMSSVKINAGASAYSFSSHQIKSLIQIQRGSRLYSI